MLILSITLIISTLLPWASLRTIFGTVSVTGVEGDGIFILILGGIMSLLTFFSNRLATRKASSLVIGILCGLITVIDFASVSRLVGESTSYVQVTHGFGLYLAILCSAGLIILGIVKDKEILARNVNHIETPISSNISVGSSISCPSCGATSTSTSMYCAECGATLTKE